MGGFRQKRAEVSPQGRHMAAPARLLAKNTLEQMSRLDGVSRSVLHVHVLHSVLLGGVAVSANSVVQRAESENFRRVPCRVPQQQDARAILQARLSSPCLTILANMARLITRCSYNAVDLCFQKLAFPRYRVTLLPLHLRGHRSRATQ